MLSLPLARSTCCRTTWHAALPPGQLGGKNFRKVFAGGGGVRNSYFGVEGACIVGAGVTEF